MTWVHKHSVRTNVFKDFGIEQLEKLVTKTKCKWVISNLTKRNTTPFIGTISHDIVEWNGVKVGVIGLVEENWTKHLSKVHPTDLECQSFISIGQKTANMMRNQGAQFIIALTHMHYPNDELLSSVSEIDLILGGHDHNYDCRVVNNKHIIKSGCDFQDATVIRVDFSNGEKNISTARISSKDFTEDEEMCTLVQQLSSELEAKLTKEVFECDIDLDTRYEHIRAEESAAGNLIADVLLHTLRTEISFANAGSIRSNSLMKAGKHTMKDVVSMFPFDDMGTVITVTGEELLRGIELAIAKLPAPNGRYPVISGFNFVFDSSLPPEHRVLSVSVGGKPLDLQQSYIMATNDFTATKDFGKELQDMDGQQLSTILANYFHDQKTDYSGSEKKLPKISPKVEGRIIDKAQQ
jgi:5'-nucleotidase